MKSHLSTFKTLGTVLATAALASAAPIHFYHNGSDYGIMNFSYVNAGAIQVSMLAAPAGTIPGTTDFQITGFGFSFTNSYLPGSVTVSNPADAASANDQNGLDWIVLANLNPIPNPSNTDALTKDDYEFGVTEGNANNLNPPGIHMGQMDTFTLSGFQGLTAATDLHNVITLQGIRLQAIEPGGSSLFLNGTVVPDRITTPETPAAVPEPSTVALMGLGLLGMAAASRRRKK